jgi:coproporphyrinogen III oxidase-like Fe-S oxidoreductase
LNIEMIMLGLRTAEEIDGEEYQRETWERFDSAGRKRVIEELVAEGMMEVGGSHYKLSRKGMMVADWVAGRLA